MINQQEIFDEGPLHSRLHKVFCCHSLCLPCNILLWPCRDAVSQNKRRFRKNGFDLDLTHIHDRIIVHGFPAAGLEHLYRNPRYEIQRFLECYHKDHYTIFNFCCEPGRGYDPKIFAGRVQRYPFKDHCTPPLETMSEFANNAKAWLEDNPINVCSLHCKAGKGRAGLMSCVLLLRAGFCRNADEAIDRYERLRVTDRKGLTLTSQRKYIYFYEILWRKFWNVTDNIGNVPADRPYGSNPSFMVPDQPSLMLIGIKVYNIRSKSNIKSLQARVFKGTNNKPTLLANCRTSKISFLHNNDTSNHSTSMHYWDCNCQIQGNFKIEIDGKSNINFKRLFDLYHNTLFLEQLSNL